MIHTNKSQVHKHVLISLLLVIIYISISIILINDLNLAFYLFPTLLFFMLINLIIEVYSTNKLISFILIIFICLLIYSNFESKQERNILQNLVKFNLFDTRNQSNSKYEYNIFFVETKLDSYNFTPKQLCAIESAAFHNPQANVVVYSIKAEIKHADLLKKYKNLAVLKLVPRDIFNQTPLDNWWRSGIVFKSQFMTAHLSDAIRLALLWKNGGFYSDLDTITIKNYETLIDYSGAGFLNGKAPSLANGFLHFRKKHPFLKLVMENFALDYNPSIWGYNGPILLKKMMQKYCNVMNVYESLFLTNRTNQTETKCDIYVFPQEYFYPYNNYQLNFLFGKNSMLNITAFIRTYSVHFYGKVSTKYKVDFMDNNVYEHFASSNCELIYSDFSLRNISFV